MKRSIPLPDPERLRHTPRGFSWVDHRLLRDGHLASCACTEALALYLVLVAAADARGISYYSDKRLAELLALSRDQLGKARRRLVTTGLIAWSRPYYQVTSLDPDDIRRAALFARSRQQRDDDEDGHRSEPVSLGEVLRHIADSGLSSSRSGTEAPDSAVDDNDDDARDPDDPR